MTREQKREKTKIIKVLEKKRYAMKKEKRNKPEFERRNFTATELRAVSDDKGVRHITGYAAVFNSLSEDLGGFREKIAPGAFARAIKDDDVRALWNHNSDCVLGRTKSGTLRLSEDEHGLKIECDPPDAQWVRDLMASIDRGDIDQMSFGFIVRRYPDGSRGAQWVEENGEDIRILTDVELFDVSPVTFPAYPDTEVGLRSLEEHKKGAAVGGNGGAIDPAIIIGLRRKRLESKIITFGGNEK
jgi:uncharacterized protein